MLSKNNYQERLRKMEPKKERFSIRKFTVGAASVLIGFTIFGMNNGQSVKADEVQPNKAVEVNKPETDSTASDHTSEVKGNPNSKSGTDQQGEKGKATRSESSTNTNPVAQKSKDATNTENQTQGVDPAKRVADKNLTPSQNNGKVDGSKSAIETNEINLKGNTLEQTTAGSNEVAKELVAQAMVSLAAQPAVQPQETTQQNLRGTQTEEVRDWQSLVNALNNANAGTIKLTGDITVANKGTNVNGIKRPNPVVNGGKMNLTGENISGGLIIDGQGHSINFGANYLSFDTDNQKESDPWDITFKNMAINADGYDNSWTALGGAFSPIYMGGDDIDTKLLAKNKVTFENVKADVKNGAFYNTTMAQQVTDNPYTTVTFKGNNNITCEAVNVKGNQLSNYSSAVSASHIIFADGTNTVFNVSSAKTNNDQNPGGNILRAKVEDEKNDTAPAIDVQQGATVTLNGKSTDVKGMLVNSAITGTVQVDGNLNANMADGHSIAIWAGNLNIGKTGVVNIDTKQSNDGTGANGVTNYNGYHYAPISLGVGFAFNVTNANSNVLDNAGTLVIKRTGDNKSTSPLISFGSGNGTGSIFTVNVQNGATLDLQDSAQSSIAGATTNTPNIGLITMWGSGNGSATSSDTINITNPAYVNFQRTGKQTGTLLRLENQVNHVNIQSNGANNPLPLAQWDEGNYNNPSYYWYINNLTTQNNWGNNSISGFAGEGQTVGANKAGEAKFLHSNGTVTMGGSQAGLNQYQYTDGTITQGQPNPGVDYETPYLNKFLNNFNWWTPQRVAMGTNLADVAKPTDAQKYQPQTQVITGYTDQTLNDLTAANGISGYVDENGQPATLTGTTVAWYNPATDADAWKDAMGDQPAPTNPTGKLKVTDGSAWAKVTYQDGTVDFANIPLDIKSQAEEYNPLGQNVNTIVGSEPSAKDGISNTSDLPTSAQYSWSTTPDVSKAGIVPSIVNVTYDDGSMDEVPVNVIVKDSKGNIPDKAGDAAENDPQGKDVSTVIGELPDPNTAVDWPKAPVNTDGNPIDPTQIKYGWSTTPDIWTQGNHPGVVKVTYPDNTTDLVPTTVIVTNSPTGQSTSIKQGGDVPDPSTVIDWTNNGKVPDGTKPTDPKVTYTWVDKPTTTNPGQQTGTVKITYPNGESTVVRVPVTVTPTSSTYNPYAQHLVLPYSPTGDGVPEAGSVIELPNGETAPAGVQYTWETKPDTTKPGMQTDNITATWTADGKPNTKYIPVTVTVGPMADYYNPKANDLTVPYNADMNKYPAKNQITDLPADLKTDDVWAPMPVTSVPGTQPTMIKVTYSDGSFDYVPLNVTVENTAYTPSYNPVSVKPGQQVTDNIVIPDGQKTPSGTKFTAGETTPNWATVDPTTGTITLKPGQDATPGFYKIPVTVSVPGKDTQTVTAPVMITGNDPEHHTYYGNQSMTSFITPTISVHRTTDSHELDPNIAKIQQIVYRTDWDGKGSAASDYKTVTTYNLQGDKYVNAQDPSDSFDANVIKYSWVRAGNGILTPNSNWDIANGTGDILYDPANPNSKEQTSSGESLPGNSKWRVNYSFDDSDLFGYIGLSTQDSWMNTYFNFYGSTTNQPLTFKQNQNISNLSQDQFKTLINVNSLENGWGGTNSSDSAQANDSAKTFTMTWAENGQPSTKNIANGVKGTVRINFSDGTYLDVPATINVEAATPTPENFTQSIVYKDAKGNVIFTAKDAIKGQFTSTTPATVSAEAQKNAIDSNVPEKWVISKSYTYPSAETVNTTAPSAIEVLVEHGTKDITPTTPGVDPTDPKYKDMFKTVTRDIYQTKPGEKQTLIDTQSVDFGRNGVEDLVTGEVTGTGSWKVGKISDNKFTLGGSAEFAEENAPQISGYDSYVDGTKSTKVSSASALENGQPENGQPVYITYLKAGNTTPAPYDPSNKDMNKEVTRTINVYKPGSSKAETIIQTVHFVRGGEGQNAGTEDAEGNIAWTPWTVATKDGKTWKSTGATEGSWQKYDVDQIDKYTSTVDGKDATKVDAKTVNADTDNATVIVAYTQTLQPTDPTINPNKPGDNSDMFASPTRTINVENPVTGKTETTHQTVWFGRTKTISTDPNVKPTYGKWQLGKVENDKFVADPTGKAKWPEFTAPTFTGYTPSQSSVAAKDVTADTPNETVTITYTKDGGGQQGGNPTPTPEPGKKPENPDDKKPTDDKKPEDKTPEKKDDTDKKVTHHKKVSHRKAKGYNHNNNAKGEQTPGYNENNGVHGEGYGDNTGVHGEGNNNIGVHGTNAANAGDKNAKTLPQTGEKQNRASIIGLALASIAGLLGFGVDRKRKHN
ncbi:Rib/alpha-like domain-containing protein [uncultured Lactobacillus sp.]|uniref:Rib/alpha-like domain-containing protein n=1 Tax=uncultured Lactobacillus sp. TaxID=153152 RepID=UPI002610BB41|nr:Rib/alpha-like domain-containing protein [uncultured Lactobacillus sp.]